MQTVYLFFHHTTRVVIDHCHLHYLNQLLEVLIVAHVSDTNIYDDILIRMWWILHWKDVQTFSPKDILSKGILWTFMFMIQFWYLNKILCLLRISTKLANFCQYFLAVCRNCSAESATVVESANHEKHCELLEKLSRSTFGWHSKLFRWKVSN